MQSNNYGTWTEFLNKPLKWYQRLHKCTHNITNFNWLKQVHKNSIYKKEDMQHLEKTPSPQQSRRIKVLITNKDYKNVDFHIRLFVM